MCRRDSAIRQPSPSEGIRGSQGRIVPLVQTTMRKLEPKGILAIFEMPNSQKEENGLLAVSRLAGKTVAPELPF
jgi:hypothetical protein